MASSNGNHLLRINTLKRLFYLGNHLPSFYFYFVVCLKKEAGQHATFLALNLLYIRNKCPKKKKIASNLVWRVLPYGSLGLIVQKPFLDHCRKIPFQVGYKQQYQCPALYKKRDANKYSIGLEARTRHQSLNWEHRQCKYNNRTPTS